MSSTLAVADPKMTTQTPNLALKNASWLLCSLFAAGAVMAQSAAPGVTSTTAAGAAADGVVTTSSGLIYRSLKAGNGASPAASDVVKVHYRGTFPQGAEFDSSYKRGSPAEFPLNRVIRCWTEGVQMMKIGGKAHLTCPPEIAYGPRGTPGGPIPPNATLHFEVELLGIQGK
jgi:FKBP-type peptidyl-prolyl cis-trans isomerase FkpA